MQEEVEKLSQQIGQLETQLRRGITSSSTINLNAGGIGVWIATVACGVMLGIGILGATIIVDQQRKIDDMQHYLNAIYMQAPSLRPSED